MAVQGVTAVLATEYQYPLVPRLFFLFFFLIQLHGTQLSVKLLQTCYITYDRDGVRAFTASGEQLWNASYNLKNPIIAVCEPYA